MPKELQHQLNMQLEYGVPHPPFHEERTFYDMVAAGDIGAILRLKEQYGSAPQESSPNEKGRLSENPLRNAVYHLIVNCTIITRCCIAAGMPQEEAYNLSDLFIRRADRCKTVTETEALNDEMSLEFARRMKKLREQPRLSPAVRKTVNYICDNLGGKLSAEALAAKAGYDRSYLAVLFKKETGITISEFILSKRIETACSMIQNGLLLSEIASALGFSSQSHFCAQFKRVMGATPKEYRNKYNTGGYF